MFPTVVYISNVSIEENEALSTTLHSGRTFKDEENMKQFHNRKSYPEVSLQNGTKSTTLAQQQKMECSRIVLSFKQRLDKIIEVKL